MKIFSLMNFRSKILLALSLPFFAGLACNASAVDIPDGDPNAPCGDLKQVGEKRVIYNNANFFFNVRFETKAAKLGAGLRSVNAGAVKYLDFDAQNQGIWRDTGSGEDGVTKTYTIPVPNNDMVQIAYCADTSKGRPSITGSVYFEAAESDGVHHVPQGAVAFTSSPRAPYWVGFNVPSITPFITYNKQPSGNVENGSFTICPKDLYCRIE